VIGASDSALSSELQVALAPVVTYQRLLAGASSGPAEAGHYVRSGPAEAGHYVRSGPAEAGHYVRSGPAKAGHYVRSLRRPALVVLVIAVMAPIMAVQRVTLGLVATAALSWSFAVVLQTIVGLVIIVSAPGRRIGALPALDLWFAGHLPYSLWMLVAFGLTALATSGNIRFVILSAVVPAVWTAFIAAAFCRTVLGTTASGGRWRAAAHFVSIWAITLSYIAWAAGGWFQLLP
jgi:hypothetical protein